MWSRIDPNMASTFHPRTASASSSHNHQMLSFDTVDACTSDARSLRGRIFAGDNGGARYRSVLIPQGSDERSLQIHPDAGLKYDIGFTVDWSCEEQLLLEEGLLKYGHEPKIMKYIKIAARFQNKTVRDVALRCQWMARKENAKRFKEEKFNTWRKMKERKQGVYLSSRVNIFQGHHPGLASPSSVVPDDLVDPTVSNASHLLEENARMMDRIKLNLDNLNVQDNVELFLLTKNNLESILNRMSEIPAMSQMASLPAFIDNDSFSALLQGVNPLS